MRCNSTGQDMSDDICLLFILLFSRDHCRASSSDKLLNIHAQLRRDISIFVDSRRKKQETDWVARRGGHSNVSISIFYECAARSELLSGNLSSSVHVSERKLANRCLSTSDALIGRKRKETYRIKQERKWQTPDLQRLVLKNCVCFCF